MSLSLDFIFPLLPLNVFFTFYPVMPNTELTKIQTKLETKRRSFIDKLHQMFKEINIFQINKLYSKK